MWERDKLFVGQILAVTQHPDADRLVLARVEYGAAEPLTVVTGAPNLYPYVGQDLGGRGPKVAFAVVGARLIDGHSAERKIATLKAGKIRGIVSQGMVCSEKELDLSDEHEGILILPDDAPVGMPLVDYMGDAVVEFDIKGAFGHLQCVVGIARETAALTGQPMRRDVLTILDRQPVAIVPDADFTGIVIQDSRPVPALLGRADRAACRSRRRRCGCSSGWRAPACGRSTTSWTSPTMSCWSWASRSMRSTTICCASGQAARPTIIMRRAHPGEHLTTLDGVDRASTPTC